MSMVLKSFHFASLRQGGGSKSKSNCVEKMVLQCDFILLWQESCMAHCVLK